MLIREIELFIEEDIGYNDISCTMVPDTCYNAAIFTKQECTLAGIDVAKSIFTYFDIDAESEFSNGDRVYPDDIIFKISGSAVSLLRAERLVLNFLGHMCGIATLTRNCVNTVRRYSDKTKVACTRKTTPGIRKFEKKAVFAGGGDPHRYNLSDAVMVKDNHIKILGFEEAVNNALELASFTQKVEVEVESVDEAVKAAQMGVDIIMLDNMKPDEIIHTIQVLKNKGLNDNVILEVSGGISPENLEEYAKTDVDVISMGSLIYMSQWIDISMEISTTE
ncbi:MAG: carboxylating nicotinate-nucleotide diphosphorylase [Methanohalobium sp.]|uniref:carboxylating nicotinate-nucleotide diphosphorylase n=1 Tax=Methanohalobium sp. TaxID=2837493 RepID=UPI0039782359